ncbi:accessory gene regulator B family protein [Brevibacillus phage Davies]|uniref:Accessory gene regulator B family protein n=1 Tax=Brevibacillus phage Davies TaxID=1296662 RepID=S5M6B1_9CAUD|nr:accessory gene regulator B family protein [Brevibacillus phage Davies]AGR47576.1 accessory gene regulator B family protein [Brevibacillus phage Davies]
MIEKVSHFLAVKIHNANPDTDKKESVEVLVYSLSITLNYFLVLFFSFLIGFLTNKFVETIIVMISFVVLRIFSKGYHAKSLTTCFIMTTAIITAIPHVPAQDYMNVINIVNILLVLFFAPNGSYEEEVIPKKRVYLLKGISLVIVLCNFIISSHIVALSFFAQSLLLLPRRR